VALGTGPPAGGARAELTRNLSNRGARFGSVGLILSSNPKQEKATMQNVRIADMDTAEIERLRSLEEELGVAVVAYQPVRYAPLSDEAVKRLQRMEREMGVLLVAYPRAA
jgi:hypothetical protein